jgi:hypothetical protein
MRKESLRHGAFGWVDLATTDIEAARAFYSAIFGWDMEPAPVEGMEYTTLKVGGEEVGGMMQMSGDWENKHPCWSIYVTVDDVDAAARQAEALGGKVIHGPEDVPGIGRFCGIQDPQGAVICAITYVRG